MASRNRVGAMNFEKVARQMLTEYGFEARDVLNDVLPEAAKTATNMIRANSRERTGEYAKGWSYKQQYYRGLGTSYVVYNKTKYRIAHLLENEHKIANKYAESKKKWKGDGVIYDAQQYTEAYIIQELYNKLGGHNG